MNCKNGFVYVLKSLKNGRFYIGSTTDPDRRLSEHNSGRSKYTRLNRPFELVFCQRYGSLTLAKKVEYWLKIQKDRDFIEKVIGDGKITKIIS